MARDKDDARADATLRPGEKHPAEYQRDLNPHALEGENWGTEGPHPEKAGLTAEDIKELHTRFPDLRTDQLRRIVILPTGSRLEQGATYLDLRADIITEFTARSDMVASYNNWYVPKAEVDYDLWNWLLGLRLPERSGDA